MKKLLLTIVQVVAIAFMAQPAFALEKGDNAPCVVLNGLDSAGADTRLCVSEPEKNTQSFTILEFFSIYCGPCKSNIPGLSKLAKEVAGNATVRAVASQSASSLKNFMKADPQYKGKIDYAVSFDGRDAFRTYGIRFTPTMMVIDSNHKIVYKHVGMLDAKTIKEVKDIISNDEDVIVNPIVKVD